MELKEILKILEERETKTKVFYICIKNNILDGIEKSELTALDIISKDSFEISYEDSPKKSIRLMKINKEILAKIYKNPDEMTDYFNHLIEKTIEESIYHKGINFPLINIFGIPISTVGEITVGETIIPLLPNYWHRFSAKNKSGMLNHVELEQVTKQGGSVIIKEKWLGCEELLRFEFTSSPNYSDVDRLIIRTKHNCPPESPAHWGPEGIHPNKQIWYGWNKRKHTIGCEDNGDSDYDNPFISIIALWRHM